MLTTFPKQSEFEKAVRLLDAMGLPCEVISPEPAYALVGVPALDIDVKTRRAFAGEFGDIVCSGWVDCVRPAVGVPDRSPPVFDEDIFGYARIMVLGSCSTDEGRIRVIAHISGDLTDVFPYMNARVKDASYNVRGSTFTFMDGYRIISAYPRRICVAKADEIVDAWRVLENVRLMANRVWGGRAEIEPSYELRAKPPAVEIYRRLPGINCRCCGEPSCLAFAVKVHGGAMDVRHCHPVFGGDYGHMQNNLLEICEGTGRSPGSDF